MAGMAQARCPACAPDVADEIPTRNDQCPCGSGLKVKRCCDGRVRRSRAMGPPDLSVLARYRPPRWPVAPQWTTLRGQCGSLSYGQAR